MNRRQFIQAAALATGALFFPFSIVASKPKISWEDFDWMRLPAELAFRKEMKDGVEQVNSIPYLCKAQKLSIPYDGTDLTQENFQKDWDAGLPEFWQTDNSCLRYSTIYTNETLLLEAQKIGYTHIYMFVLSDPFVNPETWVSDRRYMVRGARLPDWKTDHGKLQIVKV